MWRVNKVDAQNSDAEILVKLSFGIQIESWFVV